MAEQIKVLFGVVTPGTKGHFLKGSSNFPTDSMRLSPNHFGHSFIFIFPEMSNIHVDSFCFIQSYSLHTGQKYKMIEK